MIPKAQENLSEYILFLWQMEDVLRAMRYNLSLVDEHFVKKSFTNPSDQDEVLGILHTLLAEMKMEEEAVAHAKSTKESMHLLEKVHAFLRDDKQDKTYLKQVNACDPVVIDFLSNKADEHRMPFTEICINIMYGILTLRLRQMPISPATQDAADKVKACLRYLSKTFLEMNKQKG